MLTLKDIQTLYHNKPGDSIKRIGPHGDEALIKFCETTKGTVLDIGSGGANHTNLMKKCGLQVETVDLSPKRKPTYCQNFMDIEEKQWDGIWTCHTLEHIPNPNLFLKKIHRCLKEQGTLAITVPPLKSEIVSGHVTLWNAGLLLYHLILAGFDCSQANVKTYDYNISVVVNKRAIQLPKLSMHSGDIERLSAYFPFDAKQGFDGDIKEINWPKSRII